MTEIKLDSKVTKTVASSLARYSDDMFRQREGRWVGVVELQHVERAEPSPEEEKEASVKLRVAHAEIAGPYESELRDILQALFQLRTSKGTLDEYNPDEPGPDDVITTRARGVLLSTAAALADLGEDA